MSKEDRERWNLKYRDREVLTTPSPFLLDVMHLLPRRGRAIDLAGGTGRNAIPLARRGLDVVVADISDVALRRADTEARKAGVRLATRQVDLEEEPMPAGPWAAALLFHYLRRELFAQVNETLVGGGVLVAALATVRNRERNEKPPLPYLVAEGALAELVSPLMILHYEESWRDDRHEARVVAKRR